MDGEKIFLHDPAPIKSARNNLKKFGFIQEEKMYKWDDIREFCNKYKNLIPRMAPKSKNIHLELPPFSPMCVFGCTDVESFCEQRHLYACCFKINGAVDC